MRGVPSSLQGILDGTGDGAPGAGAVAESLHLAIGGPADFLVEPCSWEQVARVLQYSQENAFLPWCSARARICSSTIRVCAASSSRSAAGSPGSRSQGRPSRRKAGFPPRSGPCRRRAGLRGLEHIIGIPGTLGGAVYMNGGSLRQASGM